MANLNISIDNIGLSVRSSNALHRAGVNTVEEMLQYDEESLLQIRNLGAKSVKEILGRIQEFKTAEEEDGTDEEDGTEIGDSSIVDFLDEKKYTIDDLENLSAKAYNILTLNNRQLWTI